MSENPIKQVLSDLLPYFEALEAQSSAVIQLLQDKQIVNDEELNRYLHQAGDASSVKWRAARVRMEHLFAVSPDPKREPKKETAEKKTETAEKKELKPPSDQSGAKQNDTQADKPETAASTKVAGQPSSAQQEGPAKEKASDKTTKNTILKISASMKPDAGGGEKTQPSEKTEKQEKDAA